MASIVNDYALQKVRGKDFSSIRAPRRSNAVLLVGSDKLARV